MADDKSTGTEVVAEENHTQLEDKSTTARKKSLGGLDSTSVLSGPRQRKKAEHFQVEVKEKADFVIKAGKGTKLGDIPNVHYLLGKLKTDDELLTSLHNLLFKRPGTAHRRKKNLYEFSGMTFDDGEKEKEVEKLQERLSKWTIPLLNGALDIFELPRGNGDEGKKEAKVERLIKFLEEPKKLSEKDLAAQAAKKKDAAKAKKEREHKSKTPKSAAKGSRKSEGGQESAKKKRSRKAESEEGVEEEPSEEAEEEAPELEEQPKKRAKKEDAGASKKSAEKKTPSSRKSNGRKRKADEEEVAEEPSAEVAEEANSNAELPDDEEIKEATLDLLTVSDVSKTTVKDLLKQLKEKFGTDLSKKRAFVKRIAVEYATTKVPVSEEAGDAAEEAAAEDAAPSEKQKSEDDANEPSPAVDAVDAEEATGPTEEAKAEPEAEAVDAEPETKEVDAEPEAKEEEAKEAKAESVQPKAESDGPQDSVDAMGTGKPQEEAAEGTAAVAVVDGKAVEVVEVKD
ncbi:hypothetical protein Vretimale_3538 [Volvox reticuliferus]|uniref:DEK-C domain-containing protein n=1 Tax=Volvox reticuliferus TaxID=1737510 RepID=A0A8J4DBZ6_9CHLO|nr:hypothetical protein Vretifemale_1135 [Volvox reticuliferus]GIL98090.1 hypothetical protein Vretimale_3538 [Volvox reticuliferus]